MRGNHRAPVAESEDDGSIPTRAGNRVAVLAFARTTRGLSPRVRGNQHRHGPTATWTGSIPTRAGKPASARTNGDVDRVYPHACGETLFADAYDRALEGLSPRVRGNRIAEASAARVQGSIPTRAGKPRIGIPNSYRTRVYPHACGETASAHDILLDQEGLSPRVRGNRHARAHVAAVAGSIPTRAGKPRLSQSRGKYARVYPHACGETSSAPGLDCMMSGLSPRVRGNLRGASQPSRSAGSIPTRAGKPRRA